MQRWAELGRADIMCINGVTVLLPVYNGMPYLRPALESILNQTYRNLEVLVIDDGSTDGTAAYLAIITDVRLRVLRQANQGLVTTLNRGLREAQHDWIVRMDADDISTPERITKQVAFVEAHHEYCCVGSQVGFLGRSNQPYAYSLWGRKTMLVSQPQMRHPPDVDPMLGNIPHPSAFYDRRVVWQLGGYRPKSFPSEDYDLWLRLAEQHRIACLPEPLVYLRILPTSISAQNIYAQVLAHNYNLACAHARRAGRPEPELEDYRREHPLTRKERRMAWSALAFRQFRACLMNENPGRALYHYVRFSLANPGGCVRNLMKLGWHFGEKK